MRDYGKVSTSIWNSQKFSKVDDDAKLLYLYLHTCPQVNSVGCFVLKDGYAMADLNWRSDRYLKAMDSLCKGYLCAFDRVENLVRLINFLRFDPFTNPKHAQGAIKLAASLPDCLEKLNVLKDIEGCKYGDDSDLLIGEIDRLSIGYRNPEPEPEPEPEKATPLFDVQSEKQISPPKQKRPTKGSRISEDWKLTEELFQYAKSKGLSDEQITNEADKFKNHWIAASGQNAVKRDWSATWRNWIINTAERLGQNKGGHSRTGGPMSSMVAGFEQAAIEGAERDRRERGD